MYLSRSREMFDRWFAEVSPWETSDFNRRWVSVIRVLLSLWHAGFLNKLGAKLARRVG